MYCPKCKAEYRDGFYKCSDCDIALVHELPEEPEPEFIEYEEILSTFNPADVALIKSMLDSENIAYYFHGEHFMHIMPLIEPARLMVDKEQVERVRALLQDLNLSSIAINISDEEQGDDAD
jgi:hypothetical protein